MAFYPIQNSFMGGEISPRMLGRMDTPFYKHGVEFSENWQHLPQGPVRFRPGTSFIIPARQNGDIRLIPFGILGTPANPNVSDVVLELGDGYARLVSHDGVVQLTASGQIVLNNDFTLGSANWTTGGGYVQYQWLGSTSSVDLEIPSWESDWDPSGGGPLHPTLPPAYVAPTITQKLTAVAAANYRLQVSFPTPSDDIAAGFTGRAVDVLIGTAAGLSDIYSSLNNYNTNIDTVIAFPGGDAYIRFRMNGGVAANVDPQVSRVTFPQLSSTSTGPAEQLGLPWTVDMLPGIQYAQDIFYGMVLVHPLMPPQVVTYSGAAFNVAPLAYLGPSGTAWGAGDYPGAIDIWQSRLWLGGSTNHPTTLWASETGVYENFVVPGVPAADDSIELTLSTKGGIKWIRGKQTLLVGTELHEDIIISAGQAVSSLDAQLIRESAYGSAGIQAQDIGDQVLFISRDGAKLRSLNFNFDTQAWLAHDITFFAQGITNPGVLNIAYVRDPDDTIFTLVTDGTMRMCTYDRLQQVIAWSRWRTAGVVKSICATIDPAGTTLWAAVYRGGTTYIEQVPPWSSATPLFLDSYVTDQQPAITFVGPIQSLTIHTGGHLDGFTVGVVVDGTYFGLYPAVAGSVVIPWSGPQPTMATIGLPYTGTLTTLPLDGGVMYGSSAGLVKSRTKIFARLLPGSFLPLINGQRPSERDPQTPMNTTAPIADIDNWVVNLGWDRYARVTITMDVPLQCEVAGIFGRAEVSQN